MHASAISFLSRQGASFLSRQGASFFITCCCRPPASASFSPRNTGVEVQQHTADIRVGIDLRAHGLRWNPRRPIQAVREEAPTSPLYFAQSRATTRRLSASHIP